MSSTPHTSGTFSGQYDSTSVIVTVCCALAAYNAVELTILVFTTFNVYRGLYFWSLLVSTFGVFTYVLGWIVYYFRLTSSVAGLVLNNYGWVTMVVGQSVVLYSRLGIVLGRGSENLLKVVKWMIIIGSIIFYIPSTGKSRSPTDNSRTIYSHHHQLPSSGAIMHPTPILTLSPITVSKSFK